jgi:hypothetical protein
MRWWFPFALLTAVGLTLANCRGERWLGYSSCRSVSKAYTQLRDQR